MYICVQCRKEMICHKNSVGANYGHGHIYPGDRFKCPECGWMIIATNRGPDYDPELNHQDEYLNMNRRKEGEKWEKK